jgi:hypothetical protein
MQITEHTAPIKHMARHLVGVTHQHLVAAFLASLNDASTVRLAKLDADTVIKASSKTELPQAKIGEATHSRLFRPCEAMFLTGDTEFGRLLPKRKGDVPIGEKAILGHIESIAQVRDKQTGTTADSLHLVGGTDVTLMFALGQIFDYTARTGIVVCDYERTSKTLYGYKVGTSSMVRIAADKLNMSKPGHDSWVHVVDGPSADEPIVSFGQIHARGDGRFVVDVAFKGGKKALLTFGNDDATWSMLRDGNFAAAIVNFGKPAVVMIDDANRNLGIIPKDNLPKAFREYFGA